jgi:hypothetical protein
MPKPQPRAPRTALPEGPALSPAPDNGVDYVERTPPAKAAGSTSRPSTRAKVLGVRSYPQLGTRVPPELYERLQTCSRATGIAQAFLITAGIEAELKRRGY